MTRHIRLAHKLVALLIVTVVVSVMVPSVLLIHRGTQALTDKVHSLLLYEASAGERAVRNKLGEDVRRMMAIHDDLRRNDIGQAPSRDLLDASEDLVSIACYDADGQLRWNLSRSAQAEPSAAAPWADALQLTDYSLVTDTGRTAASHVTIRVGATRQALEAGTMLISAASGEPAAQYTLVAQWRDRKSVV